MAWYEEVFDESYLATYDALLTPEFSAQQVDAIERLLQLSPPADVLDMPCGQGRHAIELARRGYQVTGVDLSGYLLGVARQRAEQAGVAVHGPFGPQAEPLVSQAGSLELVRCDMREFVRPEAYDVAIHMFSSFGYLESEQEDARVLEAFFRCLRPGGRLVMEMIHKYWLIKSGRDLLWVETPAGFTLERVRYDVFTDRTETERIVLTGGRVVRRRFSIRQYSLVELAGLARRAGFEVAGAYGSLDGDEPLTVDSRRLVLVLRRP